MCVIPPFRSLYPCEYPLLCSYLPQAGVMVSERPLITMWPVLFLSLSLSLPDVRNGIRDDLTLIAAFSASLSLSSSSWSKALPPPLTSLTSPQDTDVSRWMAMAEGPRGDRRREGGRVAAGRMSRLWLGLGTDRLSWGLGKKSSKYYILPKTFIMLYRLIVNFRWCL